jgi:hypothetical protein
MRAEEEGKHEKELSSTRMNTDKGGFTQMENVECPPL